MDCTHGWAGVYGSNRWSSAPSCYHYWYVVRPSSSISSQCITTPAERYRSDPWYVKPARIYAQRSASRSFLSRCVTTQHDGRSHLLAGRGYVHLHIRDLTADTGRYDSRAKSRWNTGCSVQSERSATSNTREEVVHGAIGDHHVRRNLAFRFDLHWNVSYYFTVDHLNRVFVTIAWHD